MHEHDRRSYSALIAAVAARAVATDFAAVMVPRAAPTVPASDSAHQGIGL